MTRLAPRVLCSRAVSVAMRLTLWGTWTPAEPTWPPSLFVDRSYVPCAGQRYCRPLAVPLDSPQRRRRRWRIQRSELLPSRDACGLSNRARRTPVRGGGCLRDVANVGVGAFRRRGPLVSGERPVLTQVRSMACGSVLPRVAPALAWTLNKYTPAKECSRPEAIAVTGWGAPAPA